MPKTGQTSLRNSGSETVDFRLGLGSSPIATGAEMHILLPEKSQNNDVHSRPSDPTNMNSTLHPDHSVSVLYPESKISPSDLPEEISFN